MSGVPGGFGTISRPGVLPETVDPGLAALQQIRDRVAGAIVNRRVAISLTVGTSLYYQPTQDVINSLTITVSKGDLWIYAGSRSTGPPDYRVLPGDTCQFQIPPGMYDWTWLANGADTDAVVTLACV